MAIILDHKPSAYTAITTGVVSYPLFPFFQMDSVPVDNITKSVIMQNLLDGLQAQVNVS